MASLLLKILVAKNTVFCVWAQKELWKTNVQFETIQSLSIEQSYNRKKMYEFLKMHKTAVFVQNSKEYYFVFGHKRNHGKQMFYLTSFNP
jgi:hypothetical protein